MQIENATYPVNVEALNTVFSPYGFVQKIAIFEKNGQTQVTYISRILSHAGPAALQAPPCSHPLSAPGLSLWVRV